MSTESEPLDPLTDFSVPEDADLHVDEPAGSGESDSDDAPGDDTDR